MSITCFVVDDHTMFRDGVRHLLATQPDLEVVGEASNAADAVERVRELHPDIVLMDIGMPGMSSFEAARVMEKDSPTTRLVFLTMYEDEEYLLHSLDVGAGGYVLKDAPATHLIDAVREVHQGNKYLSPRVLEKVVEVPRPRSTRQAARVDCLTPREREIVKMVAEGYAVREIAQLLSISVKTIEAHKFNLMRKLNIHNTAQLVTYAIQRKIVRMPLGA